MLARLAVVVVMDDENPAWFKYSTEMLCKVLGYRECLQPRTRRPVVGARDSSPELKIMRGNETALALLVREGVACSLSFVTPLAPPPPLPPKLPQACSL